MRRILTSLLVVGVAAAAVVGATRAFFSDTETSAGNTFTAGEIDLAVDGVFSSQYNGNFPADFTSDSTAMFTFTDLKPGDTGSGRVDISATSNPYYACVGVSGLEDLENDLLDPETEAGDAGAPAGELDDFLYIALWNDVNNNGVFDSGSESVIGGPYLANTLSATPWLALSDSVGGVFGTGPLTADTTYSIGMSYCFGTFDENLVCSGAGGNHNIAQSDSFGGDLSFYAVQSRNNTQFTCGNLQEPVSPISTSI